jgi:MFS family permease
MHLDVYFAGIPWGLASDRWGRKPCLLLSMFNVTLFGILFGFSTNFHMAVLSRLAIGLGNGFMGVAKVCVTEIVQCKEHELRGFGMLNGIWGLGLIVGPAVGGILSRPAVQYPTLFSQHSIWAQYPYLLPCIVCASLAVMSFLMIYLFLEETMNKPSASPACSDSSLSCMQRLFRCFRSNRSSSEDLAYDQLSSSSTHGSEAMTTSTSIADTDNDMSIMDDEESNIGMNSAIEMRSYDVKQIHEQLEADTDDETDDIEEIVFHQSPDVEAAEATAAKQKPSDFKSVIRDPSIQFLFKVYMSFCFIITFVDESMPLWAVTTLEEGGLAFTSAETGAMLASVGLGLVIFQLFFYEMMIVKYFNRGATDTIYRLALIAAMGLALIPVSSTIAVSLTQAYKHALSPRLREMIIHVSVLGMQLFYRCSGTSAFSTLAVIVNGSVTKEMRGTINGLIMTMGSVGNACGPIIGSTLYAMLIDAPKPLDGRWIFLIAALLMLCYGYACKHYMVVAEES